MSENAINQESMLRVGTILHGSYRIDRYLSSGGFGNTYVATHIDFDETYAVKEFFMKGVTQRDGNNTTVSVSNREKVGEFKGQLEKFKKEARRLRRLNNPHIVRVHDLFEENGTAYYVMDYVDGENLKERMVRTKQPLTESEVNAIIPQVLDALSEVHANNIWHLDLKPANIMIDGHGSVKLIDFGASKQFNAQKGGATTGTAISYTPGYAPREQMEQSYEKFGPWTDFYALGGTLYNLLTNMRPPMPTDIDDDRSDDKHLALPLPAEVSPKMKQLILWLMKTDRLQRPQKVSDIDLEVSLPVQERKSVSIPVGQDDETAVLPKNGETDGLKGTGNPTTEQIPNSTPKPIESPMPSSSSSFRKWLGLGIAALLLAALAGVGYYLYDMNRQQERDFQQKLIVDSIARDSITRDSIANVERVLQDSIEQAYEASQKQLGLEECRKFVEQVYKDEGGLEKYCTSNALNYLKKKYEEEYDACEDCYARWIFDGWGDSKRVKQEFVAVNENTCRVITTQESGATYSITLGLIKVKGKYKINTFSEERYSSDWDW